MEIGLIFLLRVEFSLVFFAYGARSVWSFLLTVHLRPEIGFGLFAYGSPTVSKKDKS